MKKTVEEYYCDICGDKAPVQEIIYPVVFHTDQNDGHGCTPYISSEHLDVCNECLNKIICLDAWGLQGCNEYKIKDSEG